MILDLYRKAAPDGISLTDQTRAMGVASDGGAIGSLARRPRGRADLNVTLDTAGDPRKRGLDAMHAVTSARAALKEAQASLASSEQSLKALQVANSDGLGSIPRKTILDAENDARRNRAAMEKLAVDLDIKERQLEEAREMVAGQIKLLEIDLADAKLRLEHAENDLTRAAQLLKNASISREAYDA